MPPIVSPTPPVQIMPLPEVQKPSFVAYEVDGGLDLVTSLTHVRPGSMVMCQNYEVARQRGARRIDGYELFDGGISPSFTGGQNSLVRIQDTVNRAGITASSYAVGNMMQVLYTLGSVTSLLEVIIIANNSVDAAPNVLVDIYVVRTDPNTGWPGYPATSPLATGVYSLFSGGGAFSYPIVQPMNYSISSGPTVSAIINANVTVFSAINGTIQPVPGQGNVNGLFYLKDTVYATRDMTAIAITAGTTQPNLMDVLYQGSSFATATWKGTLAKLDSVAGSWSPSNNATGVLMVYNTTGTLAAGVIKNNTQSGATVGTASLTATPSTAAAMYVATGQRGSTTATQSWQFCDLGWTVPYTNGGITAGQDFLDMNVALSNTAIASSTALQSTTWHVPQSAVPGAWNYVNGASFVACLNGGISGGDTVYVSWPSNVYSGSPKTTGSFTANNFGFTATDIPANAVITGFELQVNGDSFPHGTIPPTVYMVDGTVTLNSGTTGGGPQHTFADSVTPWPIRTGAPSYANHTFGGKQNMVGFTNLNQSDVTSASFGITYNLRYVNQFTETSINYLEPRINNVQMRIWYMPQTNAVYFWNGTNNTNGTAVKANVVQHYVQSGNVQQANAAGVLYFQFVQANGTIGGAPSRVIGGNEKIYTYPGGGATPNPAVDKLLGYTSAAAAMNVMDWSSLIAAPPLPDGTFAPPSKYEHITKNFYASSGFDAIYGVSGAGPAFYYDGTNFSRILTGLAGVLESPRHVTEHQGHLALGYFSGMVEWSNTDNVLRFDPTLGNKDAGGQGFGERINGLKSLNGDSLAVWTRSQLKMIQGQLDGPSGAYVSVISPTSGGIEYTAQPMANWMYADFRGITSIGATQKYGDFEIGHLSSLVAPFLVPRLQLSSQFEGGNIGAINSVLVRNKNQYRLFFADGMVLTVTFLVDGEPPQFSTQKYMTSSGVALTWDVIIAATESTGRDHIYGATADGSGNVFELERGTTFNSGPIPAFVMIAGNDLQAPYSRKLFYDVAIHGVAQDYATFTMSRSPDYTVPTNNVPIAMRFGSLTAVPTGEVLAYASFNVLQMEGRAINFRFDSNVYDQPSHAIQSIVLSAKPLDDKRT